MILVTAASGNVGRAVVKLLRDRDAPFWIGTRQFSSDRSIDAVQLDFLDASTFRSAVQGCESVFLLRPPAISDTRKTLNPFLDVARAEGVRQVVFVSVAGAADHPIVPHHAVEQHLGSIGLLGVFLSIPIAGMIALWMQPELEAIGSSADNH